MSFLIQKLLCEPIIPWVALILHVSHSFQLLNSWIEVYVHHIDHSLNANGPSRAEVTFWETTVSVPGQLPHHNSLISCYWR